MNMSDLCSLCFNNSSTLTHSGQTDSNNVGWSQKLSFCIPELVWKDDLILCDICIEHIDTVCAFLHLLIRSNQTHLSIINHPECKKSDGAFACYLCFKNHSSKTLLMGHMASHPINHVASHPINHVGAHPSNDVASHPINYVASHPINHVASHPINHVGSHPINDVASHPINHVEWLKNVTVDKQFDKDQSSKELQKTGCLICSRLFKSKRSLLTHVKRMHKDLPYPGTNGVEPFDICLKNGVGNCNDAESKIDDNYDYEFDCFDTAQPSSENISQTDIVKKARTKMSFTCEQCDDVFNTGKKLIEHAVSVHGCDRAFVKPFVCGTCGNKFGSSKNLLQHKKHHTERTHICTFCGKGYITKTDLIMHEKRHFNKREYQCSDCPRSYNTKKDLRKHGLVMHTDPGQWNYVCSFCQKRFPIKSNLDQHIRRHTGEKRFKCHICEKSFVDKVVLQKHLRSHSNFRAYKCEHCEREYKDKKVLEVHLTKIHGIGNAKIPVRVKKYFCHVCPKSYFAKNKLTRHMFTHTGEKPYMCHMCDSKFVDDSYLKQHLKTTHVKENV